MDVLIHFSKLNLGAVIDIDCDVPYDILNTPGLIIMTPDYPLNYRDNLDCQVTLTFEDKVSIFFEDFCLDYGSPCNNDWLEVHDGENSDSELIGERLCNEYIPSPIESSGNSMTLVFHSDNYYNKRGFKIMARQGT